MNFEDILILIGSASAIGGILYYAYSYVTPVKPPIVGVKLINEKLLNSDPIIIKHITGPTSIESTKSTFNASLIDLIHLNPTVIGGCAVFMAIFLIYWIPRIFLHKPAGSPSPEPTEFNILNIFNVPAVAKSSESEILQKIARLRYLEKSTSVWTVELRREVSEISTSLVFELRIPKSDFKFFISKVNFSLLTSKNIFEYYKIVPKDKIDIFLYAYNNYKRTYQVYWVPSVYINTSTSEKLSTKKWALKKWASVKSTIKSTIKSIRLSILNLWNVPAVVESNELKIVQKIKRLAYLEQSVATWSVASSREAMEISVYLVLELRIPESDFEFFVNQIDFSSLTPKNIFEYYKIVPKDKIDIFLYAYDNYKRIYPV